MDKDDKIVGGHHAQAEKFRTLINWLLQGGAKVFPLRKSDPFPPPLKWQSVNCSISCISCICCLSMTDILALCDCADGDIETLCRWSLRFISDFILCHFGVFVFLQFPKLFLKFYSAEYRAIHAMARIEKDEDICYIPHSHIMTSDVAKQSEIGKKIIGSKVDLRSKHSYLASYLLQEREKGAKSRWHVYISILPRKFETIPLFFDEKQRGELVGSISLKKIDDRLESLRLEYEALCNAVPEYARFSQNDFIWARLVVITRIFGLVIDEVKTDGLVPMADMLNHRYVSPPSTL